jgi:hypothetical protein
MFRGRATVAAFKFFAVFKYRFEVRSECVRGFWTVLVTDVWVLQPEI